MAVSLIAVIGRSAKKVALFNLQATLPRCDPQTKKSLFTVYKTGKRRETSIGFLLKPPASYPDKAIPVLLSVTMV